MNEKMEKKNDYKEGIYLSTRRRDGVEVIRYQMQVISA